MPAKGMVVSSSLTRSVGFPTAWPLSRQRCKLNTFFQHNMGKLTYQLKLFFSSKFEMVKIFVLYKQCQLKTNAKIE